MDLGDFVNNTLRVGGYSLRLQANGKYEIGLVVKMPRALFPIGAPVTLQLDGRTFTGQVFDCYETRPHLSDGSHSCIGLQIEGRFQ